MTKQDLRRYGAIKRELDQMEGTLDELIERLRTRLESPGVPLLTKTPKGRGRNGGLDAPLARLYELQEMYNAKWDQLIDERRRIEEAIDALPPTERTLLRYRYIEGLAWEVICVKMHYGWDSVHRLHRYALERISDAA